MLVVKATEIHSELKTRAQSVVARIPTGAGPQAAKCFRNQHCSGIKGEVPLSCRVASCLSLSLPFSSPSIRSCLGFLTVSHPPWPTTSSPAPALAHGVSLPTTGPSLLGCLSSRFQERKRDWLSLSFLVSGAGVLPHPRAHCPSLGFCFHPCHWGDMAQTRTGDCCF